jgi:hypothetical protein
VNDLVPWQGDMVTRDFRDRKIEQARQAIAECRAILAAGRPAMQVARERADQETR